MKEQGHDTRNMSSQKEPLRLLLIGPLPPPLGGATVLFKCLVDSLNKRLDVDIVVVSISGKSGQWFVPVRRVLRIFYNVIHNLGKFDVISIHLSTTYLSRIGVIVSILARLNKQPLIIHKFGGTDYHDYRLVRRFLAKKALQNASIYFAVTKNLVALAQKDGISHVRWFSNSRPLPKVETSFGHKKFCRRFVYMGHVRPLKGIKYIIDAAERFDKDVMVDIYGPFMEGLSQKTFISCNRVHYKGILQPEKIQETLSCYDAMLMPTCFDIEGYPGSIIEAYFAGLPVICSRIGALPEIVDGKSGILIEPQNSDALYEAMRTLTEDEALFCRLREGAISKRQFFNIDVLADQFVQYCRELVSK